MRTFRRLRDEHWGEDIFGSLFYCFGVYRTTNPGTAPHHFWVEYNGEAYTGLATDPTTERPTILSSEQRRAYYTLFESGSIEHLNVNQFADAIDSLGTGATVWVSPKQWYDIVCQAGKKTDRTKQKGC